MVDTSKSIADVPEWFKGSRLNYAENLLKHKDNDKIALYAASEYDLMALWCLFVTHRSYRPYKAALLLMKACNKQASVSRKGSKGGSSTECGGCSSSKNGKACSGNVDSSGKSLVKFSMLI